MPATLPNISSDAYAHCSVQEALHKLGSSISGLSNPEALKRLRQHGYNSLSAEPKVHALLAFASRFTDPLVLILTAVALISFAMGEIIDALIVIVMILLSATLNFIQEYKANQAAAKLKNRLVRYCQVWRGGKLTEIPSSHLCPGDVLELNAGDLIPADAKILDCRNCFTNESALTGESMPVAKSKHATPHAPSPDQTHNLLFTGTSIVTGTAKAVVFAIGENTRFGSIATHLQQGSTDNEFTRGIKQFSAMILRIIIIFVLCIFVINLILKGNFIQALAFSVAVAVGLTPEFLPMILSVTMGKGSVHMAKKGVIVKKLTAIPTFGSMDVLCTDKTGTLTQDRIKLVRCLDTEGKDSATVLLYAHLNSYFQSGLTNPMDKAILSFKKVAIRDFNKIDEIPYDFIRKKMSVVVSHQGKHILITKGAPEEILNSCSCVMQKEACRKITVSKRLAFYRMYDDLSQQGFRVLAVATKELPSSEHRPTKADEQDMQLLGFTAFLDPAKPEAKSALDELESLGIEVKIITGDNELVAAKICNDVDVVIKGMITGTDIGQARPEELCKIVETHTVFARVSPNQKQMIISALRQNGHVVGYMGDGINDAPSLTSADVSISVENAVDVAKEAADIILTHKNLHQLKDGVIEGRKTFGNTMKYLIMGLSSNFGNMFSVLGAILFLPYLPMLPIQILLNNFLYDISQLTIPSDQVDTSYIKRPKRWNLEYVKKYMLILGPISSVFDFITFIFLFNIYKTVPSAFQTGWFMESLATQVLVIYIIRTKKVPFIQSRPSLWLGVSTVFAVLLGWLLPLLPISTYFSFTPLNPLVLLGLVVIILGYLSCAEIGKRLFFRYVQPETV